MNACSLCDGACTGAELAPLLNPSLSWLWDQLARTADRKGDAALVAGRVTVQAPEDPQHRAAAIGLLGPRVLKAGQRRALNLAELASKLRSRGAQLTPGAVAAHSVGRRLAVRAAAREQRRSDENALHALFAEGARGFPEDRSVESVWAELRRTRWVARVLGDPDPRRLMQSALTIVTTLSGRAERIDRRRLASDVTGDPHALDHGSRIAGLVMGILLATGRISADLRPREAWALVGVDSDDVVGGLMAVGFLPAGWNIPVGDIVTIPPRVLDACKWPTAPAHEWVFVTENPSIASAAADLVREGCAVRLLCTMGTPSFGEIAAIGRIAAAGWRVAVRADFDAKGILHLSAILSGVPGGIPWRMGREDYLRSVQLEHASLGSVAETPWDPSLASAMRARGVPAFEEALLPEIIADLRRGAPPTEDGAPRT